MKCIDSLEQIVLFQFQSLAKVMLLIIENKKNKKICLFIYY